MGCWSCISSLFSSSWWLHSSIRSTCFEAGKFIPSPFHCLHQLDDDNWSVFMRPMICLSLPNLNPLPRCFSYLPLCLGLISAVFCFFQVTSINLAHSPWCVPWASDSDHHFPSLFRFTAFSTNSTREFAFYMMNEQVNSHVSCGKPKMLDAPSSRSQPTGTSKYHRLLLHGPG